MVKNQLLGLAEKKSDSNLDVETFSICTFLGSIHCLGITAMQVFLYRLVYGKSQDGVQQRVVQV